MVLDPPRPGLRRLAREARGDPCLVLATACRLDRSLAWLQDMAGLRRSGVRSWSSPFLYEPPTTLEVTSPLW